MPEIVVASCSCGWQDVFKLKEQAEAAIKRHAQRHLGSIPQQSVEAVLIDGSPGA